MVKRFNIDTDSDFSSIIDSIESSIQCTKFKEIGDSIEIYTWGNIQNLMPYNTKIAESGFGFCFPNYLECGTKKRLIVINLQNCSKANINNREIESVIMHELGHLLNCPELEYVPTMHDFIFGKEYCADKAEKIKKENLKKKEIYADSYALQHGYGTELISTFQKQNINFIQKVGFLEERVKSIENSEKHEGFIAPIK